MNNRISAELLRLNKLHNGRLKPEHVVEAARPKESLLHGCFDWDNTRAAAKWRLHQARHLLLVSVTVIAKKKTRMFVSLKSERNKGYRVVSYVLSTKKLREQMLRDAYEDLRILQNKYSTLSELSKVFSAIRFVLKSA